MPSHSSLGNKSKNSFSKKKKKRRKEITKKRENKKEIKEKKKHQENMQIWNPSEIKFWGIIDNAKYC